MVRRHIGDAIAAILFLCSLGCSHHGDPRLAVDRQSFDFGLLTKESSDLEIPIRNVGTGLLEVTEVATTCACTVATRNLPPIAAGDVGILEVSVPAAPGPQAASLLITSNDPLGPHEVYIKWYGQGPPQLVPPRLVATGVEPNSVFEKSVSITYVRGDRSDEFEVTRVESSRSEFALETLDLTPQAEHVDLVTTNSTPMRQVRMLFRCHVPDEVDSLNGDCTIVVNLAGHEHILRLPVDLQVVSPITVSPRSVFLSAKDRASLLGKRVRLIVRSSETNAKPTVETLPGFLRFVDTQAIRDGVFHIEFEVIQLPSTTGDARIRLRTEDGAGVDVPVNVVALGQ